MSKLIQMIVTSEDNSLFLCGYEEPDKITFRVSRNPKQLHTEKFVLQEDAIFTNLYNFNRFYLDKFIIENSNNT